jgi:hypothetical protein
MWCSPIHRTPSNSGISMPGPPTLFKNFNINRTE